jgi:hypothetical protein
MNTAINVTYNTSRNKRDRDAYRVSLLDTEAAPHALRQIGEVWNNVIRYCGVYASRAEAEAAAEEYTATKPERGGVSAPPQRSVR